MRTLAQPQLQIGRRHSNGRSRRCLLRSRIVLAIHARATVGSTERLQCLTLIDRLIEAGATDADEKADLFSDS